jgi:hypothetical protein
VEKPDIPIKNSVTTYNPDKNAESKNYKNNRLKKLGLKDVDEQLQTTGF